MPTTTRLLQLVGGCVVLGFGITLLLAAELGSDGYSTFVYGIVLSTGLPFVVINTGVSCGFLAVAWLRGVRPGIGTLVQIILVGGVVDLGLSVLPPPDAMWLRLLFVVLAMPVLAIGIALYLGSQLGAGPVEAVALAWDPPLPFAVSYNVIQLTTALVGWWLGAPLGVGTVAVVVLLGPLVAISGRVLRLDLRQPGPRAELVEEI